MNIYVHQKHVEVSSRSGPANIAPDLRGHRRRSEEPQCIWRTAALYCWCLVDQTKGIQSFVTE